MIKVLVFVPGLMGSELWDDKGKLWPGTAKDWIFGYSEEKFARLRAPDLDVRDVVRTAVGIVDIYRGWIEALSKLSDYDTNKQLFTEGGAKPTLVTVPYDWRKSITVGAATLATAIEHIVDTFGSEIEIHIVAHSMGGLVARYFLQSSKFSSVSGFDRIASLLTFGTPHKGAVVALAAAIGQHKTDFMSIEQSKMLANDTNFQGLYNLLPQPGSRPLWERGGKGGLKAHDVFEPAIAKALKLNMRSLSDTKAVFLDLERPWPKIRTFMFVGSRFETMTHVLWDGAKGSIVRSRDGGDGTVNLQGAIMENQQIRFTDENHVSLIKSSEAREALQDLFNAYGVLLAADSTVSLVAAEHFLESGQPIEILLSVTGSGSQLHGKLYLERARIRQNVEELTESDFAKAIPEFARELHYDGPDLIMMNIKFEAVVGPVAFRPVFETNDLPSRRFVGPAFLIKSPS